MEKRASEQTKKTAGNKVVLLSLPPDEYQALRHYCFDNELKFAPFIRQILAERLRKESYLKKEAKT